MRSEPISPVGPAFQVVVLNLRGAPSAKLVAGPAPRTLAAAIRKAKGLTDGGLLHGPSNETQVLDGAGKVLHRFRRLTCGSLGRNGGSFRARPREVDEQGRPIAPAVKLFGESASPEKGSEVVSAILNGSRTALRTGGA